jgi:hypothetical protein
MKGRTRKNEVVYQPNFIPRLSPIQEESKKNIPRGTKRKRQSSSEQRIETSNERRKRLSSIDAFQKLLNKWAKNDEANRKANHNLLEKELKKNKNENMNLLNHSKTRKKKPVFKGLGKRLGSKI